MPRHILAICAALALAGCMTEPQRPPGAKTFASLCSTCHGAGGRGDGPIAGDLPVPPADLTGLAVRNGGAFPRDAVIAKVYGYPGRYHSAIMPEFGPLFDGATVTVTTADGAQVETPRALLDLVDYVQSLQRP
ncbi:c-type cytochrome [Lutimaribacter saemankumensis]|uniref:Cytochrome c n=1 Tax=Lutimaribacter saemankumensis TaxID=490829 RepID=A0A1G8MN59_9RHOB|nr:cytochrome c [Lutimaribacter saemankumensis]SDI69459.1 Cytochrome c [Lutimaribacter saemankumensis]